MSDSSDEKKHSDDSSSTFEVAENLDDLNLEFVDSSTSSSKQDEDLPSIDEFTFQQDQQPSRKEVDKDQWFTKVLNEELGPFPFDELVTMVLDGEVGTDDEVRHGHQGEWIRAGDIDGLFVETDDDDFDVGSGVNVRESEPADRQQIRKSLQVMGGEVNRTVEESKQTRARREQQAIAAEQELESADDVQDEPLSDNDLASIVESNDDIPVFEEDPPGTVDPETDRKQEATDRLKSWLNETTAPDEIDSETEEPSASESTNYSELDPVPKPVPPPAPYTPASKQKTKPKPRKTKIKSPKGSKESMFSGLGGSFSLSALGVETPHLVILGIVALVFGWMYLPGLLSGTNDEEIYHRFKEMYKEISLKRAIEDDSALKKMKSDYIPEIEDTVAALEADGAGSKKPIKQSLLHIGRNGLIPLIKSSGSEPTKYDERIQDLFKNIESQTDW